MRIKNFTIYGERCSGTNYLELLINKNFKLPVTWDYGWKHYFGFSDLSKSNDTLFLGIVRNPVDWLNSLWNQPHHIVYSAKKDKDSFLNKKIWSIHDSGKTSEKHDFGKDNLQSYHLYEKNRPYNNIFELRSIKAEFLHSKMPFMVNNFHFIKYEDLKNNTSESLNIISNKFDLKLNNNAVENILTYKKENKPFLNNKIKNEFILNDVIEKININTERFFGT